MATVATITLLSTMAACNSNASTAPSPPSVHGKTRSLTCTGHQLRLPHLKHNKSQPSVTTVTVLLVISMSCFAMAKFVLLARTTDCLRTDCANHKPHRYGNRKIWKITRVLKVLTLRAACLRIGSHRPTDRKSKFWLAANVLQLRDSVAVVRLIWDLMLLVATLKMAKLLISNAEQAL